MDVISPFLEKSPPAAMAGIIITSSVSKKTNSPQYLFGLTSL